MSSWIPIFVAYLVPALIGLPHPAMGLAVPRTDMGVIPSNELDPGIPFAIIDESPLKPKNETPVSRR